MLVAPMGLSFAAVACAPQRHAAPPSASAPSSTITTSAERHVYRFDFVLTASDGSSAPTRTAFTLNLPEHEKGDVHVGMNAQLSPSPPGTYGGVARADVGTRVMAQFHPSGDDLLLDVTVEMSSPAPPSNILKASVRGNALVSPGKSSLVTMLEDAHRHYELTVTPTKLR
jgi:hypothetical protein